MIEARETPKPFPWNVVIGISLMGVAAAVAADPDYPIARDKPHVPSADSVRGLEPIGTVAGDALRFSWRVDADSPHDATAWRVVVLDEMLASVATFDAQTGSRELVVDVSSIADRAASGGEQRRLHWFAEAVGAAPALHSSPLGFEIGPVARGHAR